MEFTVSAVTSVAIANANTNECPICYECISQEKNTSTTDCGHCFHTTCLLKSCSINGFNCPMCRNNMTSKKSTTPANANANANANATLEEVDDDEIDTESDFIRAMERAFILARITEMLSAIDRERAFDRLSMRENPVRPFPNVVRSLNIDNEQAEIDDYVDNMIEQQNFGMEGR